MFYRRSPSFFNIIGLLHIYTLLCLLRGRKGEAAAMQWPALMDTPFVHAVARKGRNPALQTKTQWIVSFVIYLPLSSGHKFQLLIKGGLVCPLDRVLTYKNLIYLLNLQFYCVNTSYPMDNS